MFDKWVWYNILLTILVDVIALLIFIIPLLGIHDVLKSTKTEISNIINDVYEYNQIHAVVRFASFSYADEGFINNMTLFKSIVDEVNSLKTWPSDLESIIRLTATTIIPTMLLVVSEIIKFFK